MLQIQNNMGIQMQPVLEMAEHTDIVLVASVDCKSNSESSKKYSSLMNALGLQVDADAETIEVNDSQDFNYTFQWEGRDESSSYGPLKQFLYTKNIFAQVVGSGTGLPGGLLYNVDIFTLKRFRKISSEELNESNQGPRLIFKLKGRTDLVVLKSAGDVVCNMNVKYYIEVKTVKDFKDKSSVREAILQLIGGNVGALYHSPPVLLTNLQGKHYVFNIIHSVDGECDMYSLKTSKFSTFGEALRHVESLTATLVSVTRDFARMPTPRPSVVRVDEESYGNNTLTDVADEDIGLF